MGQAFQPAGEGTCRASSDGRLDGLLPKCQNEVTAPKPWRRLPSPFKKVLHENECLSAPKQKPGTRWLRNENKIGLGWHRGPYPRYSFAGEPLKRGKQASARFHKCGDVLRSKELALPPRTNPLPWGRGWGWDQSTPDPHPPLTPPIEGRGSCSPSPAGPRDKIRQRVYGFVSVFRNRALSQR